MKKLQTTMMVLILCAGFAFAQNGVITGMSGTVELMRPGSSVYVPAKVGDQVTGNTTISTGFKSSALVKAGSAVITVRPLTKLTFAEISAAAGTETINVNLQTGRVRVDVNPPAGSRSNTSVRGPSATASVRGTSFTFDTRNITVQKGTVAFKGKRGGVMLVSAGSSSQLKPDDTVTDPIIINAVTLLPLPPGGSYTFKRGRISSSDQFGFIISYPSGP